MATKKQQEKEQAKALAERMKRTETNTVTVPLKASDLKLGNLRKILSEHAEKFNEESNVYIRDNYLERRAVPFYPIEDSYSEPRYVLTITSTKEI